MVLWLSANGLLLIVAYLLGSTPTGYWLGWGLQGIDIRQQGSGSTGATNVLRVLGKGPAILTLAIDIFKAVAAIVLVRGCYSRSAIAPFIPNSVDPESWLPWMVTLAGIAAIFGHSQSIWLILKTKDPNLTKGGKSVASALGVLLAMAWPVGLGALGIFAIVLAIFRIVSLSSMLAAIGVLALMLFTHQPLAYCLFGVAAAVYIVFRHRANIQRLLEGTEPRLGQKLAGSVE
ncbi:glycerol-3-phosphate 1-O-acyltransferase PlsY [Oscillatoriales cyanobacterium LEGE 11467]|uniref:Glycerol-3-phosphate acyltransferase n=1 Tax=Zarconia navalis LEGE 11467 TaxID=1828826 RepID=A0A928VWP3_9CYAN|nr:glycerol-3-phosphate 1-O-acyltransferase PlsY [Zarconia navalis]MBE9039185.1 glycerol-3-phosphate 1-O-acyltransferase PlsY [Zarconia navalis LEGE 11467]